jgi:hypothetical protein
MFLHPKLPLLNDELTRRTRQKTGPSLTILDALATVPFYDTMTMTTHATSLYHSL